ncbi:MAG: putative hydrolase of the superfamily [Thermoproteota archaeon]|nr:putative hydrolase of the superfamily [Thermoproteota archaeon]
MLKGILIDLGDTLTYVDKVEEGRLKEKALLILGGQGFIIDFNELSSSIDKALWNSTRGDNKNTYSFWKSLLEKLNLKASPNLISELEELWNENVHKTIRFYENVIQTLTYLGQKYQLALVSNCAVGTRELLKKIELDSCFKCTILSYELKVRKPDHKMYLSALDYLRLKPEDCLFVADEINDLEGAREVGLNTLLVHQGTHTWDEAIDPNFKPEYECNKFSEIIKLL